MPSTPGVALDVITGNIPITLWLEEESAKGALSLKNLNHWQHPLSGKLDMRLTSHITTNEKLLKSISDVRVLHDQKTPSLSIDQGFAVDIPNRGPVTPWTFFRNSHLFDLTLTQKNADYLKKCKVIRIFLQ